MPVVKRLMDALKARYGDQEGERVYYAMEAEGKGPFGPKGKHHDLHQAFAAKHGVTPRSKGKPPAQRRR